MTETKNTILFYVKDSAPLTFTKYKIYDLGTGYIALQDDVSRSGCLCRILDDKESSEFSHKNTLVIKTDKVVMEKYVIIITELANIQEADEVISKFKVRNK